MSRFGVLGWPVSHSRSPAMFRALGVDYQLLPVPPELFAETVPSLAPVGFAGANVTIPHKEAALALAHDASGRARAIGAANTLTFTPDGIHADNTDAPGFLAALPLDPAGKRAFVLGAGGSARAVVWALQQSGAEVRVWNRTREKAEALGAEVADGWLDSDILVNCTSIGLGDVSAGDLPIFKSTPVSDDDLGELSCVVDLVYRSGGTDLERAARAHGIPTVDGLEILVQQGALSYERWTGRTPDLDVMRTAARDFDAPTARSDIR